MRLAIMQPYFLPYIGYFQLLAAVDSFVLYDHIKYTKKGWINRNRILVSGTDKVFSLSLKKDSDFLDIVEREISQDFSPVKLLSQFKGAYRKAPYFEQVFSLLEKIMLYEERNLFKFIYHSIVRVCEYLGISTEIRVSSHISISSELKSQDRVISLCQVLGAHTYINAIGGMELYNKDTFKAAGIELKFIKSNSFEYLQFDNEFIPWLSIVDVMMFNDLDTIRECIFSNYQLI
ncbi:MAG: WbqC family protein [Nodosilinea sp.]